MCCWPGRSRDCSRDVAERSGDDFIGGEFVAIGAAGAAGAKLITNLDLGERSGLGIVELDRARGVAAQDCFLPMWMTMLWLAPRPPEEIVMVAFGAVNIRYQAAGATFLPVVAFALMFRGDVGLFHYYDGEGGNGVCVGGQPGRERAHDLPAEDPMAWRAVAFFRSFSPGGTRRILVVGASVAVTSPPDSAATVIEPGWTVLIVRRPW